MKCNTLSLYHSTSETKIMHMRGSTTCVDQLCSIPSKAPEVNPH